MDVHLCMTLYMQARKQTCPPQGQVSMYSSQLAMCMDRLGAQHMDTVYNPAQESQTQVNARQRNEAHSKSCPLRIDCTGAHSAQSLVALLASNIAGRAA